MVQPPYPEDKAKLPVGLYIQWVYTEMKDGSQNISTVLCNGTGKPMHLTAGPLVGHIVAANLVPDAVASPELEAKPRTSDEGVGRERQSQEVERLEERDGPQG